MSVYYLDNTINKMSLNQYFNCKRFSVTSPDTYFDSDLTITGGIECEGNIQTQGLIIGDYTGEITGTNTDLFVLNAEQGIPPENVGLKIGLPTKYLHNIYDVNNDIWKCQRFDENYNTFGLINPTDVSGEILYSDPLKEPYFGSSPTFKYSNDILEVQNLTVSGDLIADLSTPDLVIKELNTTPYLLEVEYDIFYVDTSGNDILINLPAITGNENKNFKIVKTSELNEITISPNGGETISGNNVYYSTTKEIINIIGKGTDWITLERSSNYDILEFQGFENREDFVINITNVADLITCEITCTEDLKVYHKTKGLKVIPAGIYTGDFNGTVTGIVMFFYDENYNIIGTYDYILDSLLLGYSYYRASDQNIIGLGKEGHTQLIPKVLHEYLHNSIGYTYTSGLSVTNLINTDTDEGGRILLTPGTCFDEDIRIHITEGAINGDYRMPLGTDLTIDPLDIRILYKLGPSGEYFEYENVNFQIFIAGIRYCAYNNWTGVEWELSDVAGGNYMNVYILATNNNNRPITAIIGQDHYGLSANALAENFEDLNIENFVYAEFSSLFKITIRARSIFDCTNESLIYQVTDIRNARTINGGSQLTAHNALSNLSYEISGHTSFQKLTNIAVIDPDVNDDIDNGFYVGQLWVNSNDTFICSDNSSGAAVWNKIVQYSGIDEITCTTIKSTASMVFQCDYNNDGNNSYVWKDSTLVNLMLLDEFNGHLTMYNNINLSKQVPSSDLAININNSSSTAPESALNMRVGSSTTFVDWRLINDSGILKIQDGYSPTYNDAWNPTSILEFDEDMSVQLNGVFNELLRIETKTGGVSSSSILAIKNSLITGLSYHPSVVNFESSNVDGSVYSEIGIQNVGIGGDSKLSITDQGTEAIYIQQGSVFMENISSGTGNDIQWGTNGEIVYVSSVLKDKMKIEDYDLNSLELISNLQLKKYERKNNPNIPEIGLIADDLEILLESQPELSKMFMTYNNDELTGYRQSLFHFILIDAVNELIVENKSMKLQLLEQNKKILTLEKTVGNLSNDIINIKNMLKLGKTEFINPFRK